MDIILYEDEAVAGLHPVTLLRPAFDIRTAGYTLEEAVRLIFPKAHIVTAAHNTHGHLFLNARLAPNLSMLQAIAGIIERSTEECAFVIDGIPVGSFTMTAENISETASVRHELTADCGSAKLLTNPEDIIFFNKDALKENLSIAAKKLRAKKKGLYLGRGVKLPKQCVYDTTHGPVIIGDGVTLAPFTVLKGPLIIRENSVVKEFSVIEHSTIGPVCKVGGEISGSVIDGHSNKQHAGHLGDSYIGRWVNLAAGTGVSNLKNTYSHIMIGGRDSGSQFLGTVMGDHSKMATNASIFPGKIVGMCAQLYGMVTSDVPSFTSFVSPGSMYELPLAVAEKGQKAMMARRGATWTETDTTRFKTIFETTKADRETANVSQEKLSF